MSDDTTVPDSEQRSIESLLADLTGKDSSASIRAHCELQRQATDLARQVVALRAQVAAHEDADRRWSADMEALRDTLNAATSRLEAYGAIAHVVVGYDDATPDVVVAACTELPFVRIENRRLRDKLAVARYMIEEGGSDAMRVERDMALRERDDLDDAATALRTKLRVVEAQRDELRLELQEERDFRAHIIADRDARSGEPL